jgi:cleavage and polyadenylation specificity factor subunit 1
VLNIWAVACLEEYAHGGAFVVRQAKERAYDRYILLSMRYRTMILASGKELQEMQQSDFFVDGPTIAVGTLLNDARIVQVYKNGVILLNFST